MSLPSSLPWYRTPSRSHSQSAALLWFWKLYIFSDAHQASRVKTASDSTTQQAHNTEHSLTAHNTPHTPTRKSQHVRNRHVGWCLSENVIVVMLVIWCGPQIRFLKEKKPDSKYEFFKVLPQGIHKHDSHKKAKSERAVSAFKDNERTHSSRPEYNPNYF